MTRKAQGKKLGKHRDPGQQEFERAKKQAREKTQLVHRRGPAITGPRREQ